MEVKNFSVKLINIAGLIALISGSVYLFLYLLLLIVSEFRLSSWLERGLEDIVPHYGFVFISLLANIGIGIFLMVSSTRLKENTRPLFWSAIAVILSGVLLFEFRSGMVIGVATASMIGLVGGGMRLYVAIKDELEVGDL